MATRLYFPLSNDAAVIPAFMAWTDSSQGVSRFMANVKGTDTITVGQTVNLSGTGGDLDLDRQYVSTRMASGAVFTSGVTTFSMQLMTREYDVLDVVDQGIIGIRIMSEDGATTQATLKALGSYGPTSTFINNATHRNKEYAAGITVGATYTTVFGDRLVVEIGYSNSLIGTTPQASAKWGQNATDLPANETQTTDGAGWIEFSNTITFVGEVLAPTRQLLQSGGMIGRQYI